MIRLQRRGARSARTRGVHSAAGVWDGGGRSIVRFAVAAAAWPAALPPLNQPPDETRARGNAIVIRHYLARRCGGAFGYGGRACAEPAVGGRVPDPAEGCGDVLGDSLSRAFSARWAAVSRGFCFG